MMAVSIASARRNESVSGHNLWFSQPRTFHEPAFRRRSRPRSDRLVSRTSRRTIWFMVPRHARSEWRLFMNTSIAPETPKAPPLQKQTTVGNYFVSNYPPFSFWKPELVGELISALERPPATIASGLNPLGIYVHIPFCRKRCHFCYFKVYTDKDSASIRGYVDAALKELSLYAVKPFLSGRRPNFVYFGGGTPSYLSVDQLRHLTRGMQDLLPWDE